MFDSGPLYTPNLAWHSMIGYKVSSLETANAPEEVVLSICSLYWSNLFRFQAPLAPEVARSLAQTLRKILSQILLGFFFRMAMTSNLSVWFLLPTSVNSPRSTWQPVRQKCPTAKFPQLHLKNQHWTKSSKENLHLVSC